MLAERFEDSFSACRSVLALVLALVATVGVNAEDARLAQLRDLLVPMRANNLDYPRPEFTTAKHLLRDWIESRLGTVRVNTDLASLSKQLNDELTLKGLSVKSTLDNSTGYVGDVTLEFQQGFLVVRVGLGVLCATDESAYAYRFKEGHWKRYWQSEQNDYRKDKYFPQTFQAVLISRQLPDPVFRNEHVDRSEHLVLTLGFETWCASNWHNVYYRVWQTGDRYPEPKLLLSGFEWAWVEDDPPIAGEVEPDEVLVEYIVNNTLSLGFHRPEVRHYKVNDSKIARVDPVALGPKNFVAEWLDRPWLESAAWTESTHKAALGARRQGGESLEPTMHCKQPDLWQVSTDKQFYLVRWKPPFHFTMVDVSDHPWPTCTEVDREADEWRTMFRPPGWQWEKDSNSD